MSRKMVNGKTSLRVLGVTAIAAVVAASLMATGRFTSMSSNVDPILTATSTGSNREATISISGGSNNATYDIFYVNPGDWDVKPTTVTLTGTSGSFVVRAAQHAVRNPDQIKLYLDANKSALGGPELQDLGSK